MDYKNIHVTLDSKQFDKLVRGKAIRIKKEHIGVNDGIILALHKNNYQNLVRKSKATSKRLSLSKGEIIASLEANHDRKELEGSGFFDWVKKAYNHIKNNWGAVYKPIASAALDGIATLAGPKTGGVSLLAREGIKQLTGVGTTPDDDTQGSSFRLEGKAITAEDVKSVKNAIAEVARQEAEPKRVKKQIKKIVKAKKAIDECKKCTVRKVGIKKTGSSFKL